MPLNKAGNQSARLSDESSASSNDTGQNQPNSMNVPLGEIPSTSIALSNGFAAPSSEGLYLPTTYREPFQEESTSSELNNNGDRPLSAIEHTTPFDWSFPTLEELRIANENVLQELHTSMYAAVEHTERQFQPCMHGLSCSSCNNTQLDGNINHPRSFTSNNISSFAETPTTLPSMGTINHESAGRANTLMPDYQFDMTFASLPMSDLGTPSVSSGGFPIDFVGIMDTSWITPLPHASYATTYQANWTTWYPPDSATVSATSEPPQSQPTGPNPNTASTMPPVPWVPPAMVPSMMQNPSSRRRELDHISIPPSLTGHLRTSQSAKAKRTRFDKPKMSYPVVGESNVSNPPLPLEIIQYVPEEARQSSSKRSGRSMDDEGSRSQQRRRVSDCDDNNNNNNNNNNSSSNNNNSS
ncbi:hypothetical protein EDD21DRAFT_404480, partial [Dissophora ornata]